MNYEIICKNHIYISCIMQLFAKKYYANRSEPARAVQVLIEKGKVYGIKVVSGKKKAYIVKARTIVLSAGSLETPRILLYSGVQGYAIGHYLIHHSSVRAKGTLNRDNIPIVTGSIDILIPQTMGNLYQIQIQGNEEKLFFTSYGKVESRFENQVTLNPNELDENGVPKIQVDFSYTEQDKRIIHNMGTAIKQVSSAMGAVLNAKKGISAIKLRAPGAENHESGTCRMGDDPQTSVTNRYGQVHSVPGLYVADNSVLPSHGAANPTLTTIALAIRTADHIIQQAE